MTKSIAQLLPRKLRIQQYHTSRKETKSWFVLPYHSHPDAHIQWWFTHWDSELKLRMMSKLALVGITLMTLSLTTSAEAVSFRCGVFSFLGNDRACRASCWVTGQTSGLTLGQVVTRWSFFPMLGHCDYNGNCMCSEKDLDLGQSVRELLGGLDVLEYVQLKFDSFIDEVDSWQISEKVKSLIPTRCQLGDE